MNNKTIQNKDALESLGFSVDIDHDPEWDTHIVDVHFHGNTWAKIERHKLENAMSEALNIIKCGVYGKNIIN